MSYNLIQRYVDPSKYSIKCPYSMVAKYITVHNTANDASAQNEVAYMSRNAQRVSFHVAVDDVEVIECIPFNRSAWHAGDGNGAGNRQSIGIEICYSLSGGERFDRAEENAAAYIATLLTRFGWGVERVKRHYDWSRKNCPHRTMEKGWGRFLDMIRDNLANAGGQWRKSGDSWWYQYAGGNYATGWKLINDQWYYFNGEGYMQTGWLDYGDNWYHLADSGVMDTGWQEVDGSWYWFSDNGAMKTGWVYHHGNTYYLQDTGKMATGWLEVEGEWYYFITSGEMQRSQFVGDYYLGSDGAMLKNTIVNVDGKRYLLDVDGKCIKDQHIDIDTSGVMKFQVEV